MKSARAGAEVWVGLGVGVVAGALILVGLWAGGAWATFASVGFCFCSGPLVRPVFGDVGWSLLGVCFVVAPLSVVLFSGFGTRLRLRDRRGLARGLDFVVGFAQASVLVLGGVLLVVANQGTVWVEVRARALLRSCGVSAYHAVGQVAGSAMIGVFLLCVAIRSKSPHESRRVADRVTALLAGMLWAVVPACVLRPPFFMQQ